MKILTTNKQFKKKIEQALKFARDCGYRLKDTKYIIVFYGGKVQYMSCPFSGVCLIEKEGLNCSKEWLASTLIHENNHFEEFNRGLRDEKEAEKRAYKIQYEFLKRFSPKEAQFIYKKLRRYN